MQSTVTSQICSRVKWMGMVIPVQLLQSTVTSQSYRKIKETRIPIKRRMKVRNSNT
uniref:Uncharacterized protein n=1 Tax=Anguilla anguilla TaxID=7936 RepID=A0A0E9XX98_ANGAN